MSGWPPNLASPAERARFNGCQSWRCGHRYDQHAPMGGRCEAYHCHCRGWTPLTREQYEGGRR